MGIVDTVLDMSFSLGLMNRSSESVGQWITENNIVVEPDGLAWLIAHMYAWADVFFVGLIVFGFLAFMFYKKKVGSRKLGWVPIVGTLIFCIIWAAIFSPFHEAEEFSVWVAQFMEFWNNAPLGPEGMFALLVAGATMIMFFNHWGIFGTLLSFCLMLGFNFFIFDSLMNPTSFDKGIVVAAILVNFAFIYFVIKLPIWAMAGVTDTAGTMMTGFWVFRKTMPFTIAYVWVSAIYPGYTLFNIPISLYLLILAVVLAAMNIMVRGRKHRAVAMG